ncbi:MAG: M16 family metallopeptidase, partial [Minisyncoccales bacterium]
MPRLGFLEGEHISGIKKKVLANGISVFLEYLPEHKKVIFLVGLGVGSRNDPPELAGISHFLEHLQFQSNRFRSADDINEDLEEVGTDFDAGTDFDSTVFYTIGYPRYLGRSIKILYEALTNFEYNENELERERLVVLTELKKSLDSPEIYYFDHLFIPALLRKTPLEKPILGTIKALKKIRKEDLIFQKRKYYLPQNMIIFVCGKFEEEALLRKLEKTFGHLKPRHLEIEKEKIPLANRYRVVFKHRKNLKLAYLALGYRVPGYNHVDSLKFLLLESILSGGASSRLYKKLRSEKGIGYNDL